MADDCRIFGGTGVNAGWWKSTLVAANPEAAALFAVAVLGASLVDSAYEYIGHVPPECTAAAWVRLPGLSPGPGNFELHFVRASELYQKFPGEINAYTQQVRSLRNLTAGTFDAFMYNSLMLHVDSLDPFVQRLQKLNLPALASRTGPHEFALFLDVPENDIIIQLRSEHLTVEGVLLADFGPMQW